MAANVYDTVLLFGDSITEGGWAPGGLAQRLSEVYGRRMDVISRGLGGYNSEWGLTVFKQIFATKEAQKSLPTVRLLTIWWGANDAVMPGERQYVDISKFAENLHTTISLVTSPTSPYYSPDTRVVLITPPPVYVHQRPGQPWDDRNNVNTKAYADQVIRVGEETGVPVVDVWTKFWEYADGKEEKLKPLLTDGLHLTSDGYSIVFDELLAVIKSNHSELLPDNIERIFPAWDAVDPDNIPARKRP